MSSLISTSIDSLYSNEILFAVEIEVPLVDSEKNRETYKENYRETYKEKSILETFIFPSLPQGYIKNENNR